MSTIEAPSKSGGSEAAQGLMPALLPFAMPKLAQFRSRAIFADLTSSRARVLTRHRTGVNVLFGDGSGRWVDLKRFDQAEQLWPEPTFPPDPAFNQTLEQIWTSLDRG